MYEGRGTDLDLRSSCVRALGLSKLENAILLAFRSGIFRGERMRSELQAALYLPHSHSRSWFLTSRVETNFHTSTLR